MSKKLSTKDAALILAATTICAVAVYAVHLMTRPAPPAPARPLDVVRASPSDGSRAVGQESAKKILRQFLKNPDAAEYPWETVESTKIAGNQWLVSGVVRSTNSFGAMVTERWEVLIVANGDAMFPISLSLNGRTVWTLKAASESR